MLLCKTLQEKLLELLTFSSFPLRAISCFLCFVHPTKKKKFFQKNRHILTLIQRMVRQAKKKSSTSRLPLFVQVGFDSKAKDPGSCR
jgi:hypothetical protein